MNPSIFIAGDIDRRDAAQEKPVEKPVHSEKLTRMLTAQRTAAIQAAMMKRPDVALAALVHRLALQVFSRGYVSNRIVQVNLEQPHLKPDAENIGQSRAALIIEENRQYWKDRIDGAGEGKTLFGWLLEQPQQDLLDLLAFCVSVSVNTVSSRENEIPSDVSHLMNALDLDMADWWEATGDSYLSHVSKERILGIVCGAVSPRTAQNMNGCKKGDLVRQAEQALSGLGWLPGNFKPAKPKEEQQF